MLIHYRRQILKGRLYLLSRSFHALRRESMNGLLGYETVVTVCREKENHRFGLFQTSTNNTNSKCFKMLSCAYTVKLVISIYSGDFSLLIFEHAMNLKSKIGSVNSDDGFQMFCMRIRFSLGRYSFVWTDIATDLSGKHWKLEELTSLRNGTSSQLQMLLIPRYHRKHTILLSKERVNKGTKKGNRLPLSPVQLIISYATLQRKL